MSKDHVGIFNFKWCICHERTKHPRTKITVNVSGYNILNKRELNEAHKISKIIVLTEEEGE